MSNIANTALPQTKDRPATRVAGAADQKRSYLARSIVKRPILGTPGKA